MVRHRRIRYTQRARHTLATQAWVSRSTQHTLDIAHASGVRSTRVVGDAAAAPTYLRKTRVDHRDIYLSGGEMVRFAVSTEDVLPPPGADAPSDPPAFTRSKLRHSFCHKYEVLYELTEVRTGHSAAAAAAAGAEFEVELEWIGAQVPPVGGAPPAHALTANVCASKLLGKVGDLVEMKRMAGRRAG